MSINPISLQFRRKNVMWDHVKSLTEIKIDNNNSSYLIHQHSFSIAEGHKISQSPFILGEAILTLSIHFLSSICFDTASRRSSSVILLGTEVTLTDQ